MVQRSCPERVKGGATVFAPSVPASPRGRAITSGLLQPGNGLVEPALYICHIHDKSQVFQEPQVSPDNSDA